MVVTTRFCIICVKGASPSAVSCVTSLGNPCNQKLTQLPICFREGNGTPLQYSRLENPIDGGAWWAAVHGVAKSRTGLSDFTFTFHFHASEKEMATHSSVLAWRIPGTGEPGGLPSTGSHRVGHDWSDLPYLTLPYLTLPYSHLNLNVCSYHILLKAENLNVCHLLTTCSVLSTLQIGTFSHFIFADTWDQGRIQKLREVKAPI